MEHMKIRRDCLPVGEWHLDVCGESKLKKA